MPLLTPATVTVRRGGSFSGSRGAALDDDLAANLFCGFCSPSGSPETAARNAGSPGGEEVQEFGGFKPAAASQPLPEAEGLEEPGAAQPADAGGEFSFFPSAAAAAPSSGPRPMGIMTGMTPELAGAGGPPAGSTISPEILGYYEQQAAAAACTPALPR